MATPVLLVLISAVKLKVRLAGAVMEGGVMLSRSYRSVEPFDRAIAQLREHFRLLLQGAGAIRETR